MGLPTREETPPTPPPPAARAAPARGLPVWDAPPKAIAMPPERKEPNPRERKEPKPPSGARAPLAMEERKNPLEEPRPAERKEPAKDPRIPSLELQMTELGIQWGPRAKEMFDE